MDILDNLETAMKSQKVRFFDIYALGPFMLWYSWKSKGMGSWPRRVLFVSGVYTVLYNLKNYRSIKADLEVYRESVGV